MRQPQLTKLAKETDDCWQFSHGLIVSDELKEHNSFCKTSDCILSLALTTAKR